MKLLNYNV